MWISTQTPFMVRGSLADYVLKAWPASDMTARRLAWIHQLMLQEMSDPTPALDLVVEQVLRPRLAYIRGVIAAIIGCAADDPRVIRCLMSVQAQLLALMKNPVADRLHPTMPLTPQSIEETAGHIVRFSIAGIRAIAAT